MVATDIPEPRDGELRSQHPDTVVESFTSIDSTPTTEIQNDFDNPTLQNVELPSALTSTLGGSLQEQLGIPNDGFSFSVAEIESATPTPRGVSEGIEVASFTGDVSDLDGDYVVEEPPTAEASVVSLT